MTNIKKGIMWRVVFGMSAVVLFAIVVSFKMFTIQIVEGEKWLAMSDSTTIRRQNITPARGNIYSDDGSLLSTSMPIYEIRWDATVVNKDTFRVYVSDLAIELSSLFPEHTASYYSSMLKTARRDKNRYKLIRRKVDYHQQKAMAEMPIFRIGRYKGGFLPQLNTKRVKPAGELAHRTIGWYHNEQNQGVGLERSYDQDLGGVKGERLVQRISGGNRPLNDENLIEPQNGRDVHTTINIDFQEIAHRSLEKALIKHNAHHGSVVVMEVATGKIKAIANLKRTESGVYRELYNYAIGESYEPGSVWKVYSAMAALEDGLINSEDSMDILNGERDYFGKLMRDSDRGRFKKMSFKQAFARSSNVAFSSIVFDNYAQNPSKYISHLRKLDLDKTTGIEILGDAEPFLNHPESSTWSQLTLPWLAIGYENQHTALQLLTAYNGIINNGDMIKPRLVNEVTDAGLVVKDNNERVESKKVCSKETSAKIKELTAEVFLSGSASGVRSSVVSMGGKTGTAQIATKGQYQKSRIYNASFVGHFPADEPVYSVFVMVNQPSNGQFYASSVAAPVFAEVAEKIFTISVKQKVDDTSTRFPNYTSGYYSDFKVLNSALNVELTQEVNNEVIAMNAKTGKAKGLNIEDNKMPNVSGLGAKDAVYLLERYGLQAKMSGYGRVVEQSPTAGSRVTKNQHVYIRLN
ncbi:MAG: cell division protein FtsI (penicillin-binding protein 3) [Pseudoalteromonas distincta]|jgi:cell division protein FtsI (penicillin-binding protein 3)